MVLQELVAYLDDYLAIGSVPDYPDAFNGLQVEGRETVNRVALAVDACAATIEQAVAGSADMLLVHHGLFWGSKAPVTGPYYRRLSGLIRAGMSLYSCHLPLDAHPEVGNNHVLARRLGLHPGGRFGEHEGVPIGVWADVEIERSDLAHKLSDELNVLPLVLTTGPSTVKRVAVVTGGAGSWVAKAKAAGCDTLITGEGPHHTYFDAEEMGVNVMYAGHYATETVGAQALGDHLRDRLRLDAFFIDYPTGL